MAKKGGKAGSKTKEVPYGLDKIEKYNAEKEDIESDEDEEVVSGDDEEVLDLGLSDDEYDFGEDEEEFEDAEEEGVGYDFDEDAHDRKEKRQQMDEEDAGLLGDERDDVDKPFGERLTKKDLYGDEGDVREAEEQQRQKNAGMAMDDFDMDVPTTLKSNKKSKDERIKEKLDAELDEIDFGNEQVEKIDKKLDSAASVQEKIARVKRESPELLSLLKDFKEKAHELNNIIVPVLEKIKQKALPTSEGISFLEAKHQLLLSYCTNISFYLLLKSQGKSVKDHPVIDQLARIRAIIEKTKPIEKKLAYQIDKLVRSANLGTLAGGDEELTQRANPADLQVDSDDEETEKLGLYRAPRVAEEAMETIAMKQDEKILKERQRKKRGKMTTFLQEEYGDAPVESNPNLASADYELTAQERELEELEEANMRRKELTKADRKRYQMRVQSQGDILAGLGDYTDLGVYDDDMGEKKKDQEFLDQKRMRAHMDAIDARNRQTKKRALSNDADTWEAKKARPGMGMLGARGLLDEEISEGGESDNEANVRRPRFEEGPVPAAEEEMGEGDKRKADKRIEQNRGMRRIRNKSIKTPRTRYQRQFARKVGQMGGSHKIIPEGKPGGLLNKRISTNVSRSKTFAN